MRTESMREKVFKSEAHRDGDECALCGDEMRVSGVLSCDRESDMSETNSFGSREEESVGGLDADIVEEKFRVDRKKLEKMLQGPEENKAENFFISIMTKTETVISWPSQIKIGGKSKKDPFVKATGKIEAVRKAKDLVMAELDISTDRVTLKMDVPYTDHSHIIGKGGLNTQRVMHVTNCHIHFPDSNRNNAVDKSNLVSIAGRPPQVEKARSLIRALVPLCLTFKVPMQVDVSHSIVRHVQDRYAVSVQVRHHNPNASATYVSTVMVRANESDADRVKEATRVLMQHLVKTDEVSLKMEIGAQHSAFVANVAIIEQLTGTEIDLTKMDDGDGKGTGTGTGTVTIRGSIESVHLARLKIIGALQLALMFDLGYDVEFDTSFINQVMDKFGVLVTTKPKAKNSTRSIIIKGIERKVGDLLEARRCLLGLEFKEPSVPTFIPLDYNLSSAAGVALVKSTPPPLIRPNMFGWSSNVPLSLPYQCRPIRGCGVEMFKTSDTTSAMSSPTLSPSRDKNYKNQLGTQVVADKDRTSNTSITRLQQLFGSSLNFSDESVDELENDKQILAQIGASRVPNNKFVGYGFSQSMPDQSEREQTKTQSVLEKRNSIATATATATVGAHYNLFNSGAVRPPTIPTGRCDDLSEFLTKIGCELYADLFRKQEVDMDMFTTLDEDDLKQLGVPTFGARRKMMEAIKNQLRFSAAPGAERRAAFCNRW
uniref:SAM domain-containing protein n=1 Tax=Strigamia maritima TaxID=126957 RepID=T1INT8_STRMM